MNSDGLVAQVSFGMDNYYKCEIELWGSKGSFIANRILTAPDGFTPKGILIINGENKVIDLPSDDTFKKSIEYFYKCIINEKIRFQEYDDIIIQSRLVDTFKGN